MPKINCERDKYLWIYEQSKNKSYGKRNFGFGAYEIILNLQPQSLLDVGCGRGRLVEWAKTQGIDAVGLDFASGYGVCADLVDMPFDDNSFDVVTAFDVLEHLRHEDLELGLDEICRFAKSHLVLSIGYGPSKVMTPEGPLQLHPICTRDRQWWTPILARRGKVNYEGKTISADPYIIIELGKER